MILLDTNVVSEPLRSAPAAIVVAWINAQPLSTLFLSAVTVAELRVGVARLPNGKRKAGLHEDLEQRLLPLFADRVLAFDLVCSQAYAQRVSIAGKVGRVITGADAYIAATAATHGFAVATRDVSPFEAAGLQVINPWQT
mgnify:CR=1 FL=1